MNINIKEKIKKFTKFFRLGETKNNSNYINRKQIRVLSLLFIFVFFLAAPLHQARAFDWDPLGWLKDKVSDTAVGIFDIFIGGISVIIYNIGNFALNLAGQFVHFAAFLVDVMMDQNIYRQVLTSGAIQVGWETMRDFCNMFFIFFLLIIAFSTILRISDYSAKTMLPKFLIALFMINFSMEIAKLVIDFGQVFMYEIRTWMGSFSGSSGGASGLTGITDYFNDYFNYSLGANTPDAAIAILFAASYSFILGLTYIMLAGFLLIRLLMFAILIIVSPFAFFGAVMPSTRRYWSEWWSSIVKYALFGPIFIFFVYIASRMAFELTQSYDSVAVSAINSEGYARVEALKDFLPKLIPNIIALMMLWAVIPITQRIGIAGSSRLIGGTAGLGTVAMGSWGAAKLAGGWSKKAVGAPAERLHAWQMGKGGTYQKGVDKFSGWLKTKPIAGRVFLEHQAEKSQERKEAVSKHQKIMENFSDKDKKAYVDSFFDPKARAEAQQAMFNILAKDSGKGLTNTRLAKMGYADKDGNFDEDKFKSDYNRAKAYGHDTSDLETYRPDMIEDEKTMLDKVTKTVEDGKEKSIKLSALEDEKIDDKLQELLGKKRYDTLINSKSQAEKDEMVEHYEGQIVKELGKAHPDQVVIDKLQTKAVVLAKPEIKEEKMGQASINPATGRIQYNAANLRHDIAQKSINKMTKDQFLDLDTKFLENYGHMLSTETSKHIARFGDVEQAKAIKFATWNAYSARPSIPANDPQFGRQAYEAEYRREYGAAAVPPTPPPAVSTSHINDQELKKRFEEIRKKA